MEELAISLGNDIVSFNPTEAHNLSVAPAIQYRNPLTPGGELVKTVGQKHEYKMLHLNTPRNVLQPQSDCKTWNPITRTYMDRNEVVCAYFEVNEEMCPDEFFATSLYNLTAGRTNDVEAVMVQSDQPISAITGAVIVELQKAIGSSAWKIAHFGDPLFGEAGFHAAGQIDLLKNHSVKERDNLKLMMQKTEGWWTILRRRAGNKQIKFVTTNDGTAAGNATLATNIRDFLKDLVNNSHPVLKYAKDHLGITPVILLQDGLFEAYYEYLTTLPGGEAANRYIVDGFQPSAIAYRYKDYPVLKASAWESYDYEMGLFDETTGLSKIQRAVFTIPENLCMVTNVRPRQGIEAGLQIQTSPLIKDKGNTWMYMNLGLGMGIAHNDLITVGYNTSYTYATS